MASWIARTALRQAALCALLVSLAMFWIGCGGLQAEREAMPDPLDGVEAQELFDRGVALGRRGDAVRAEQYVSAAMDRGFPESEAIPYLVKICAASSRFNTALNYAEPYLEEHPEDWGLRLVVATMHLALNNRGRAQAELERIVREEPEQPTPYYLLAVLHRDAHANHADARPYFARYLELAPEGEHAEEARSALQDIEITRDPESEPGAAEPTEESPDSESTAEATSESAALLRSATKRAAKGVATW